MTPILIQNRQFFYSIIRKPIRSVNLRLLGPDSFVISCPRLTPLFVINQFIKNHIDWIIKNSGKLTPKTKLSPTVIARYKTKAKKIIIAELQKLSRKYHFNYGRVSLRNQKTRFGSCSHSGNLSFNWQIIFFPEDKFRHILLHELVHLTIKNHSPRFWAALAVYDPNYLINRRWIKKEGHKLFIA